MRLFLALWPDDDVRARLVAAQRGWTWPARVALTPPERLHVTLHFLGEVDDAAARALATRLPRCSPFSLTLDRSALWPQGIAVLEAGEPPPALLQLHAALAAELRGLGLRVETRRWRPHVTLARHAEGAVPPASFEPVEWLLRGVALVRSHAGPPLRYEVIARSGG